MRTAHVHLLYSHRRAAARALNNWRVFAESKRCGKAVINKAQYQLYRAVKIRAARAWRQAVSVRQASSRILAAAARRLHRRIAATSFTAWVLYVRDITAEHRRSESLIRIQASAHARAHCIILRGTRRAVASAFDAWCEQVQSIQVLRHSTQRLTLRRQRLHLRGSFSTWSDGTTRCGEIRVKVRRSLQRMSRRVLSGAISRWNDEVLGGKARAAALIKADRVMLRARHRVVATSFEGWNADTCQQKHLRYRLQKLSVRWQRLQLAARFCDWIGWVGILQTSRLGQKKLQHSIQKLMLRRQALRLGTAFHDWSALVEDVRVRWLMIRKAVQKRSRSLTCWTIARWRGEVLWVSKQAEVCVRAERILRRRHNRAVGAAFFAWVASFSYRRSIETFIRLARARAARRHIVVSFAAWRRSVHTSRTLDALGSFAVTGAVVRTVRSLLARWVEAGPPPLVTSLHLSRKSAMMSKF